MGLLPGVPDTREIRETVNTFITALHEIDRKLGQLLELERRREDRERTIGTGAASRALGVGVAPGVGIGPGGGGVPGRASAVGVSGTTNASGVFVPGGGGASGAGGDRR